MILSSGEMIEDLQKVDPYRSDVVSIDAANGVEESG